MPRPDKALQKQGYKHYFTAFTGRARIAYITIIHSKTSFVGYCGRARHYIYHLHLFCGRGMPRPYKALREQGYKHYFTALTEALRSSLKLDTSNFLLPMRVR